MARKNKKKKAIECWEGKTNYWNGKHHYKTGKNGDRVNDCRDPKDLPKGDAVGKYVDPEEKDTKKVEDAQKEADKPKQPKPKPKSSRPPSAPQPPSRSKPKSAETLLAIKKAHKMKPKPTGKNN
jgi:hypothetical protein